MTASYSGSTNGFYQPSKATANYVIPSTCNQQSIIQEIWSQQNMLDAQLQGDAQYMTSMVQGAMGQMVNMGEPFRTQGDRARHKSQQLQRDAILHDGHAADAQCPSAFHGYGTLPKLLMFRSGHSSFGSTRQAGNDGRGTRFSAVRWVLSLLLA